MDRFECNAPQYLGNLKELANNADVDNADSFFETPNQSMHSVFDETLTTTPKDVFYTPRRETPYRKPSNVIESSNSESSLNSSDVDNNNGHEELDATLISNIEEEPKNTRPGFIQPVEERKSSHDFSVTPNLNTFFKEPEITENPESTPAESVPNNNDINLPGPSGLQKSNTKVKKSAKKITFDGLDKTPEKTHTMVSRLDLRKNTPRYKKSTTSSSRILKRKLNSPSKMTMAEQILHFHKDTPPRFKARVEGKPLHSEIKRLRLTIAQSPKLATKLRATASKTQQSLGKPTTSAVASKEVKLSTAAKKTLQQSFMNHSILSTTSTRSRTDHGFVVPTAHVGVASSKEINRRTNAKPFSFEARDKARQEEKENRLEKLRQEETPVFKFTAKPVPAYLRRMAKEQKEKS